MPAFHVKPWRWFDDLIGGLLTADTRLARHFAPRNDDDGGDDDAG